MKETPKPEWVESLSKSAEQGSKRTISSMKEELIAAGISPEGGFVFDSPESTVEDKAFKVTGTPTSNELYRTRCYLIGHMQYSNGRSWRSGVQRELKRRGIVVFNPYEKPFVKDVAEDETMRKRTENALDEGNFDDITERMKTIRSYDLNLVDRSDFVIAHLIPDVASWGSAEELVTAVRMKKPTFISIEGGKKACPLWLFGMFPHKYIYDSVEDLMDMIKKIDNGERKIDSDRWRLLKKELR